MFVICGSQLLPINFQILFLQFVSLGAILYDWLICRYKVLAHFEPSLLRKLRYDDPLILPLHHLVGAASEPGNTLVYRLFASELGVESKRDDRIIVINRDEERKYLYFVAYVVQPHIREFEVKIGGLYDAIFA